MMETTLSSQPAFIVGVTGHISLHADDVPRIRHEVRLLLLRL